MAEKKCPDDIVPEILTKKGPGPSASGRGRGRINNSKEKGEATIKV